MVLREQVLSSLCAPQRYSCRDGGGSALLELNEDDQRQMMGADSDVRAKITKGIQCDRCSETC